MEIFLKISIISVLIFMITELQSPIIAQDKNKKDQKQNTGSNNNTIPKKKPVFDPAKHPIETDSIAKMKKRASKGDASDYKEYMKTQNSFREKK